MKIICVGWAFAKITLKAQWYGAMYTVVVPQLNYIWFSISVSCISNSASLS